MAYKAKLGYLTVAYQESMPDDWQQKLESLGFGYSYCLHDKDVWKSDGIINGVAHKAGELKKPHIHFFFQGVPTMKQKKYIHDSLGVNYGEDCRSANGAYDYLTHENDPDKYHYSKDSISYSLKWNQEAFDAHYVPKRDTYTELLLTIKNNGFYEYHELMEYLAGLEDEELIKEGKALWVMRYMDSRRYALMARLKKNN